MGRLRMYVLIDYTYTHMYVYVPTPVHDVHVAVHNTYLRTCTIRYEWQSVKIASCTLEKKVLKKVTKCVCVIRTCEFTHKRMRVYLYHMGG